MARRSGCCASKHRRLGRWFYHQKEHQSVVRVTEETFVDSTQLGLRSCVDEHLHVYGVRLVHRLERRRWLRGCRASPLHLRSQLGYQLDLDTPILWSAQYKIGPVRRGRFVGNDGCDGNSILPGESRGRLSYRSLPRLVHSRHGAELRYLQGQPDAGPSVDRGKEEVKTPTWIHIYRRCFFFLLLVARKKVVCNAIVRSVRQKLFARILPTNVCIPRLCMLKKKKLFLYTIVPRLVPF